jgi:hypothetical protein
MRSADSNERHRGQTRSGQEKIQSPSPAAVNLLLAQSVAVQARPHSLSRKQTHAPAYFQPPHAVSCTAVAGVSWARLLEVTHRYRYRPSGVLHDHADRRGDRVIHHTACRRG